MEEYNLEIIGEAIQIFKVLSKDDVDKMPFEGIQISKSFHRIPFFTRFFDLNSEMFINLCISEKVTEHPPSLEIYSTELQQRYLYVILQGQISIHSQHSNARNLGIFDIFGQTEIIFNLPTRLETAVCVKPCKLMKISADHLLKIFRKAEFIKECLHYLNINNYFDQLNEFQKMQLVLKMKKDHFERNTVISQENDPISSIMFLIYGKINISHLLQKQRKRCEYIIDELTEMSVYGEYETVFQLNYQTKLKSSNAGAYYYLNYAELQRSNHKLLATIHSHAIPYPSDQELTFLHGVKTSLKKQQNKVVKALKNPFLP